MSDCRAKPAATSEAPLRIASSVASRAWEGANIPEALPWPVADQVPVK